MIEATVIKNPVCMALGFFDSLHVGHRQIINCVKSYAQENNLKSSVFTFSNNAYKQFNVNDKLIYTYIERLRILKNLDIDYVVPYKFDKELKAMDRETFLIKLVENINVKCFICGYDYLFGANGSGDINYLREFCTIHDIVLKVIPEIKYNNERVSSTLIKNLLSQGNISKTNELLGDTYFMSGKVVKGRGVGRLYNIPTANLSVSNDKLLLKDGVYGTYAVIDGKKYKAMTNIGAKPTFNEPYLTIESMLIGLDNDIYDKNMDLYFYKYIRDIFKFDSPEELSNRIHKDLDWE